ncbi:map/microtubule affinity-regulating kinase [Anaeramoeba flamelloides]|uniref:Map/microtubule affinity-regulating kinase n=1 Tax=Anaeramoeba flamelloides TaxID=1746091 RepID=A0ABQ8Y5B3_9EUKA|nr:map/microtubule affinity-regulating kinase [Anaeramoeba flamelloides]
MTYLHSKNLFYLNLNPKLIFINSNFEIKLKYFGFEYLYSLHNTPNNILNKFFTDYEYCSPEIINNSIQNKAYEKCDIWSFGLCTYYFLTGKLPFDHKLYMSDIDEEFNQEKEENDKEKHEIEINLNLPAFVNNPLSTLIQRMLQIDVTQRVNLKDIHQSTWITDEKLIENNFTINNLKLPQNENILLNQNKLKKGSTHQSYNIKIPNNTSLQREGQELLLKNDNNLKENITQDKEQLDEDKDPIEEDKIKEEIETETQRVWDQERDNLYKSIESFHSKIFVELDSSDSSFSNSSNSTNFIISNTHFNSTKTDTKNDHQEIANHKEYIQNKQTYNGTSLQQNKLKILENSYLSYIGNVLEGVKTPLINKFSPQQIRRIKKRNPQYKMGKYNPDPNEYYDIMKRSSTTPILNRYKKHSFANFNLNKLLNYSKTQKDFQHTKPYEKSSNLPKKSSKIELFHIGTDLKMEPKFVITKNEEIGDQLNSNSNRI